MKKECNKDNRRTQSGGSNRVCRNVIRVIGGHNQEGSNRCLCPMEGSAC